MDNQIVGQSTQVAGQAVEKTSSVVTDFIVPYAVKTIWAIIAIILLLMISRFIANMVKRRIIKNWAENKNIDKVAKTIHDVVFYVLVIFSFFIGFEIVWFNVWLILWGLSFGVWLAFKEILGNMIAGIMMLYTKEFKLWDIVEIQADQVYFGRIEEIAIRYTVIRTLDLRQVVIPNMTLITVPIKTFSSEELVKLKSVVGIHYKSDVPKAIKVLTDTVNSFEFVKDKENTKAFVSVFSANSIDIKFMFYFDPKCGIIDEIAIGTINVKIAEEFKKNEISIPYNMVTLNFEDEKLKQKFI